MSKAKLNTGKIVCTMGIGSLTESNPEFASFVSESMRKHISFNWGDIDEDDWKHNDDTLSADHPGRILSAYNFQQLPGVSDTKIWIITEWNREVTTILFPSEY